MSMAPPPSIDGNLARPHAETTPERLPERLETTIVLPAGVLIGDF